VLPYVKVSARHIVLTHARVIDGTSAAEQSDQTIVIQDGKISSLGSTPAVRGRYGEY